MQTCGPEKHILRRLSIHNHFKGPPHNLHFANNVPNIRSSQMNINSNENMQKSLLQSECNITTNSHYSKHFVAADAADVDYQTSYVAVEAASGVYSHHLLAGFEPRPW